MEGFSGITGYFSDPRRSSPVSESAFWGVPSVPAAITSGLPTNRRLTCQALHRDAVKEDREQCHASIRVNFPP